ncbi:hypothetical protein V5301_26475, partial [Escherichia coli]
MNKFLFSTALIVTGLLVCCKQLTLNTITEQEINHWLGQHNKFSKHIGFPGVGDGPIFLT